jgi:NADH-quinone oxidoreductase subunit E
VSADGKFSWEEVECLGACSNAPMAQIGKDYYEDLSAENFGKLIDDMAAGNVPLPGPQNGRFAAEPLSGLTSLTGGDTDKNQYNASVALAADIGDTLKRIDGTEVPLLTPWLKGGTRTGAKPPKPAAPAKSAVQQAADKKAKAVTTKVPSKKLAEKSVGKPDVKPATAPAVPKAAVADSAPVAAQKKPRTMKAPRKAGADDLKMLKGVGPKLEETLNTLGFWHFDQVAKWTAEEISWVDDNLKFKGRIERDGWVEQAKILAAGGTTEFSKRAKY